MVKIICEDENERNLLLAMFDAYWDRHADGREFKEMYGKFGIFDKHSVSKVNGWDYFFGWDDTTKEGKANIVAMRTLNTEFRKLKTRRIR